MTTFRSDRYEEYLIEHDDISGVVYISGKDKDGFWTELETETDIAEPESYAWGVFDTLRKMGVYSTVYKVEYD